MYKRSTIALLAILAASNSYAQKKPLDHSVYDAWKSISSAEISRSGNYLYYTISPQEGDALLEVKTSKNSAVGSIPRGYNPTINADELFLVAGIKPLFAETRAAKIKKKKPDDMPQDSLAVLNLTHGSIQKYGPIKSFQVAQKYQAYVAYLATEKADLKNDVDSTKKVKPKKASNMLHILNLQSGEAQAIPEVQTYAWSPDESQLVYYRKTEHKDSTHLNGLYLYQVALQQSTKISAGTGDYVEFTFDDQSKQLSFLANKAPEKALLKDYKLYYYTAAQDSAQVLAQQQSAGVPQNWYISGDAKLQFSASGDKLFFGLAPIPKVKDTTLVDFEHAKVDIWHWQDDYLQTQQLVNLKRDQSRSYLAVVRPKAKSTLLALANTQYNRIQNTDLGDNEWIIASSDQGYRIPAQWEASTPQDIQLVSTNTGQRIPFKEKFNGQLLLSPDGQHIVYFDQADQHWYSYSISNASTQQLTKDIPVSYVDEQNDSPIAPRPYGVAGWSADHKGVYIYDRYDVWYFDFAGKRKFIVTNGYGRATATVLRYLKLEKSDLPRQRTSIINNKKNIFLTAYHEPSKQKGLYETHAGRNNNPKQLLLQPYTYQKWNASADLSTMIYTKEDYSSSPNLYVNSKSTQEEQLTDINPQQEQYNWGTAELVKWTTPAGHAAEGILYKPENFDPNKKYPIIAYFYEKLSDGLYSYHAPAPTPSRLNIPYFVSNEYLVFAPDIQYETGFPGKSAEEYVNSGMRHLANSNAWVDSTKMGIQGQSWGGYQVAHLITRTNMYAAAWSGAPVVNMTSAYGGIRWQSGMSRQFQYERTQSRLGKTLWEGKDLYIENSPLFYLDKVQTPVAIMHNDRDGAVPWYQGIEMFTALRRLSKPVWMLNYNNDEHNLMLRQNRKDIQMREAQFFDHFLKGKPAATWISKGVPAIDKGIDWGFDIPQ